MEEQIILRGRVEKKANILKHPEFYQDVNLICFHIRKEYISGLITFGQETDLKNIEITLKPWPEDVTTRAIKYFFAMRDALVLQTQGNITPDREYKTHLYRSCIKALDIWKDDVLVDSYKDLDKKGMYQATELMKQWCLDAGADIRNLTPEVEAIQKELKESKRENSSND